MKIKFIKKKLGEDFFLSCAATILWLLQLIEGPQYHLTCKIACNFSLASRSALYPPIL